MEQHFAVVPSGLHHHRGSRGRHAGKRWLQRNTSRSLRSRTSEAVSSSPTFPDEAASSTWMHDCQALAARPVY